MPIHLIWGDDDEASNREIEEIIETFIDPDWKSFNFSRLDGIDPKQASLALEEILSSPLGQGGRVVLLKRSPFCNVCSIELANKLEKTINLIPDNSHLILNNANKPDKRLKTTKLIQKSINSIASSKEKSFILPLPWDFKGQRNLVINIARQLKLEIDHEIIDLIVDSYANNSSAIKTELQKISLLSESQGEKSKPNKLQKITKDTVNIFINNHSTNAIEISNLLLNGNTIIALVKINYLLESGEPALRLLSTLTGQVRGWLWVNLLDSQGKKDIHEIAKLAGIGNPKRIFIIRRQIQGKSVYMLLELMKKLLKIEASIKSGSNPIDAFKDNLLTDSKNETSN